MVQRGRAFRRVQARKRKEFARRLWRQWSDDDPEEPTDEWVGVMASTHGRPCSCEKCSWPKGRETRQEKAARLKQQEGFEDFWEDWRDWTRRLNYKRERIRSLKRWISTHKRWVEEHEEDLRAMEAERWPDYGYDEEW